ncbi:MAG: hypothetical protein ACOH2N_00045 [Devosia sp.]
MPQVRFVADFDWKPSRQITVAYRSGDELLVTTACANAAMAAKKAVKVSKKKAQANG